MYNVKGECEVLHCKLLQLRPGTDITTKPGKLMHIFCEAVAEASCPQSGNQSITSAMQCLT